MNKEYYKSIGYNCFGLNYEQLNACKGCTIKKQCKEENILHKTISVKKRKTILKKHSLQTKMLTIRKTCKKVNTLKEKHVNYTDKYGKPIWSNFPTYIKELETKMNNKDGE